MKVTGKQVLPEMIMPGKDQVTFHPLLKIAKEDTWWQRPSRQKNITTKSGLKQSTEPQL